MLTQAQIQLLDYADALDGPDLVKSLKLLHNIAVYHSSEPLDEAEKDALFNVKGLWECIERIVFEKWKVKSEKLKGLRLMGKGWMVKGWWVKGLWVKGEWLRVCLWRL